MSTQMPTLFDDEAFFVPPPKKEGKPKTTKSSKTKQDETTANNEAINNFVAEEISIDFKQEETENEAVKATDANINTTEITSDTNTLIETEALELIDTNIETTDDLVTSIEVEDSAIANDQLAINEIPEIINDNNFLIETEELEKKETIVESSEAIKTIIEKENTAENEANSNAASTSASFEDLEDAVSPVIVKQSISFEIPEETTDDIDTPTFVIPSIKEEIVDDLDVLYRQEIIAQDYSSFSNFQFEPKTNVEKKKTISKADEPIEKTTIDVNDLDFELEEATIQQTTLPEFELENKYYTIGEVAELFGVNVSHIRFWTTEFKLKVRTTRKGDRLFNPENIARLRLIHHLVKENKHTIKGAKEKLKLQKLNVSSQVDLKDKLTGLKEKLERIKRNL